jgi:hypothetical protein
VTAGESRTDAPGPQADAPGLPAESPVTSSLPGGSPAAQLLDAPQVAPPLPAEPPVAPPLQPEQPSHAATSVMLEHSRDPPGAAAVMPEVRVEPLCDNCGQAIAGEYCSHCGQRVERHIHSLRHFLSEALESLTHADSRLWRTLWPLLAKPGFLTAEFFAGRRVRYLPPFRLYLVISAVFFLIWVGMGGPSPHNEPSAVAAERIAKVESCENANYSGPFSTVIQPRMQSACRALYLQGPHALTQGYLATVPKAAFILLPVMAAIMKLMYWRPRRYYVEHLLFFVHSHAFVLLLLALSMAAVGVLEHWIVTWPLTVAVSLYIFYYFYAAMRRVYGQSRRLTRVKFAVLSLVYFVGVSLLLALSALYSFLTMV